MDQSKKRFIFAIIISIAAGAIAFFLKKGWIVSLISFAVMLALVEGYFFISFKLRISAEVRRMEIIFPDFIDLMASNLRAGMTVDRALLLSSRKEFAPLDREILRLGKEIVTGRDISDALRSMGERTRSDKIKKTIALIVTGIKSGGNLSTLLEETAVRLRERQFIEKRAASNVLMYEIFIFFAIAIGAPALFALSSVLVNVLSQLLTNIPTVEASVSMPFSLTKITISGEFVMYFSLVFLIAIDVLASLLLGLVNKGEERAGLSYTIPLILVSVTVFFVIRIGLLSYFSNMFG